MDTRESLTLRTVTAIQRLADLEMKGKDLTGPKGGVVRTALRELEMALEELRVASEQLNQTVDEIATARADVARSDRMFHEFREMLPVASFITDPQGTIADANAAAGELLNVAPRHLGGKPLALYMTDRDRFFALLSPANLATGETAELIIRPRERKPRPMLVNVGSFDETNQLCWFFREPA
jgi:PAS domain-containing protein